jgi:hypothetical protein
LADAEQVRWLDYAISSSLMIVILDLLFVAPPDLRSLVFAGTASESAHHTPGGRRRAQAQYRL